MKTGWCSCWWAQPVGGRAEPEARDWGAQGTPGAGSRGKARQGKGTAGSAEERQCCSVSVWLRVPNGLEEREWLRPGRKVALLHSTQ